jgi:hypothetical protein
LKGQKSLKGQTYTIDESRPAKGQTYTVDEIAMRAKEMGYVPFPGGLLSALGVESVSPA